MDTSNADLMSSPDPLNDETGPNVIVPSSTNRVTRSQRSSRFMSLGGSPRKQTFELEVGNNKSPQKLLVTVETEDAQGNAGIGNARRRLFQGSSPVSAMRRRERATTTIVPLKETVEDEPVTPRRRGRPRKSNGTPLPGAGAKRRAGTPLKKTPRRARTTKPTEDEDDILQQSSVQPTPKRRGRPPKNRSAAPSSELGTETPRKAPSTTRPRQRRQALAHHELIEMVGEAAEEPKGQDAPPEVILDVIHARSSPSIIMETNDRVPAVAPSEAESDIWMATLDDEPTPRPANRSLLSIHEPSPQHLEHGPAEPQTGNEDSENEGFGYMAAAASDLSSVDEPQSGVPRSDTIAQGEDFSMIFMDSIPSLQETLRSSMQDASRHEDAHNDFGEETSLIINNTLESLRQSRTAQGAEEQDQQEESQLEMTEAAEPSLPVLNPPASAERRRSAIASPYALSPNRNRLRTLSPRWSQSPRRGNVSPLRHEVLRFRALQTEDEVSHAAEVGSSTRSPNRLQRSRMSALRDDEDSNAYEDSFSEIPQRVLDAATPRRPTAAIGESVSLDEPQLDEEVELEEEEHEVEEHERAPEPSNVSVVSRSDNGRLPTPDDTPPHVDTEEPQDQGKSTGASSPLAVSQGQRSIIPEIVEEDIEQANEEPTETALPMISQPVVSELVNTNRLPQMEVTPINQLTSPLQEPQSVNPEAINEKLLRPALSPIVRAGRALQSVTSDPPSPEPREKSLGSPFRSSASKDSANGSRGLSVSPRRPLAFPEVVQIPPVGQVYDDPFGSDTRHTGQISFMQALGRSSTSMVAPQKSVGISSRESTASSMRITPPSEDEMSWVADEGPISSNLRGDVSLKEVAARSSPAGAVSGTITQGRLDASMGRAEEPSEADDQTNIWEVEAKRSTPRPTRQKEFGHSVAAAPLFRRGTIPSPWTRQAARAEEAESVHSQVEDEEVEADRTEDAREEVPEREEYSMLARKDDAQDQPSAQKSATKPGRFDLSSFFSSPAAIPGKLAQFLPERVSMFAGRATHTEPEPTATLPTSSMFPQVQQQRESQPRTDSRTALSASNRSAGPDSTILDQDITPDTPEKLQMPTVPQKMNFTPRPRQPSEDFFHRSARSGAPTPPRMQLSHADIQRWQQETSNASDDSPASTRTLLRPLPPKNASPTKSSLRSPLKPHTPGRVVEFTSSVLSPVEQARARQQRRLSNSSPAQQRLVSQVPAPSQTAEKENHDTSDVSMSDASPLGKPQQLDALSPTVWTRQHWLFLNELLQLRRKAPFETLYERRADKYLGKTVKSQGEAMRLERWHLDCVDAFKAEVGGWDEGALVKRLFSLIVGEERRRQGIVERSPRVMFH